MKADGTQEFLMLESAANVLALSERGLSAELTGGVASCRSGIPLKLAGLILKTCKNISRNI